MDFSCDSSYPVLCPVVKIIQWLRIFFHGAPRTGIVATDTVFDLSCVVVLFGFRSALILCRGCHPVDFSGDAL